MPAAGGLGRRSFAFCTTDVDAQSNTANVTSAGARSETTQRTLVNKNVVGRMKRKMVLKLVSTKQNSTHTP